MPAELALWRQRGERVCLVPCLTGVATEQGMRFLLQCWFGGPWRSRAIGFLFMWPLSHHIGGPVLTQKVLVGGTVSLKTWLMWIGCPGGGLVFLSLLKDSVAIEETEMIFFLLFSDFFVAKRGKYLILICFRSIVVRVGQRITVAMNNFKKHTKIFL